MKAPFPPESDACVTSQFVAADRTATDLKPLGADATGEIEALDILEVLDVRQPSSIAPFAVDMKPQPPPREPYPSRGSSTVQLERAAGIPAISENAVVAAATVLALCIVAGVGGVLLGSSQSARATLASVSARRAPRSAIVLEAREEVTQSPLTALAKDVEDVSAPASAPAVTHRTMSGGTGILHVVGSVSGALVDGTPHRVVGGAVTVACGHHRVKLPGRSVRNVNVPCGGSTTF